MHNSEMQAVIVGAGMGGLFAALALRESKRFERVDVYEQTLRPSTAGAGLNIAPNGARLCKWVRVDLDGGDPKGPAGAIDGGRASILEATCQVLPDNTLRGGRSTTTPRRATARVSITCTGSIS